MPLLINTDAYRSILCLDGALPPKSFFDGKLPIIAADGAANQLIAMNITPSMVVGDLDAVDKSLLNTIPYHHVPEQETNDYQKCLAYLEEHALLPAIICGINGGCLDHILNNVNIFLQTGSIFYAPPLLGLLIKENETRDLHVPINTKISCLGFPKATVSSTGLKWELDRYSLAFPGKTSCFNRSIEHQVSLHNHQGSLLALIYETAR